MIEHHELLYADLADPVALLRQRSGDTQLAQHWAYAAAADPRTLTADRVRQYTQLMAASQPLVSQDVLEAYDFSRHRCLLDVGGGDGTFLAAVAARHPGLRLQLFDLPGVVSRSRPEKLRHADCRSYPVPWRQFPHGQLPLAPM